MSKKQERVSIRKFEEAAAKDYDQIKNIEWNGINIEIKSTLSLKEMAQFVSHAVKACFSPEDGSYVPEAKDFAIRALIILLYTNITLPSNQEKMYECLYGSSIVHVVTQELNKLQLDIILDAIDDKIEYLANTHTNEIGKQISKLGEFGEQLSNMFNGITKEDINNIANAVGDGNIDEEKLMRELINSRFGTQSIA